jgi:adenylyltransferase/sulfurtransferase
MLDAADIVIEGSDNFATKFLASDACALAQVPIVHGGALQWGGWALSVQRRTRHATCLRCVFEDVPDGPVATCATAGVIGPVVGVIGAAPDARVRSGDQDGLHLSSPAPRGAW